jgi:glycosyltransferase involved in cell wall biosynthesis
MKVLIISGIWPPDIGGPASHGPEFGRFLLERGHQVRAVTSAENGGPVPPGFPIRSVARDRSRPVRLGRLLGAAVGAARDVDIVYAPGAYTRSAIAATLNSRPLVMKVVTDPAYERARRLGFFSGGIDEFQREPGNLRVRALKETRNRALKRAARIVTPGQYLERLGVGWGLDPQRFVAIPNPAPRIDLSVPRDELRRRFGMEGPTFVFTGRFVRQKNVPLVVRALRHVPDASLVLIGDGVEKPTIEEAIAGSGVGDRIAVHKSLPLEEAMQWVRAADAAVLPSDWEPGTAHAIVEALSVGTPPIVTAVGALPEIVQSGVNGLLVPPGDEHAFGEAMASLIADPDLLDRLRRGAVATGDRFAPERAFEIIERQLHLALESA